MSRLVRGAALGAVVGLVLAGCGGGGSPDRNRSAGTGGIVVGSANLPESRLVGEVYAQALEAKGLKVTRKFNIGGREIYYEQIKSGVITVVPEYTGALLTFIDKDRDTTHPFSVWEWLRSELPPTLDVLLSSAETMDTFTVTSQTAQKYHLTSIDDLKEVAGRLTIGGSSEFKTSRHGLVALEKTYGLKFKKFRPFDSNVRMSKLLKNNTIQAAVLSATDPAITANKFVELSDVRQVFSVQGVIPLIYEPAMNSTSVNALNDVSHHLKTKDLRTMMAKLVIDRKDPSTIAKDWLKQEGLVN